MFSLLCVSFSDALLLIRLSPLCSLVLREFIDLTSQNLLSFLLIKLTKILQLALPGVTSCWYVEQVE